MNQNFFWNNVTIFLAVSMLLTNTPAITRNNPDFYNMFQAIYEFPEQLEQARAIGSSLHLKHSYNNIKTIVCAGMGGSAMAADIVVTLTKHDLSIPCIVTRNYTLPNWVNQDTLVILFSYSGNTEETIAAFHDAKQKHAHIAGICSGGTLEKLLQENNSDYITIPGGMQPRAALGYLAIPMLYFLHTAGLASDECIQDLQATIGALKNYREDFSIPSPNNLAYSIAEKLYQTIPLLYGESETTAPAVIRWRAQLAENSKMLASSHLLPELNHNEIVGWQTNPELLKHTTIIWLLDSAMHQRNKKRYTITKEVIGKLASSQIEVMSKGTSPAERIFYLVHLGDWVSYWAAILHDVDPTPVEKINYLKVEMAKED